MRLHILLMREMTGLNLSLFLRLDTQISISARFFVGHKSNNDAYKGLSCFELRCIGPVRRCVLRGDANNSREYFLLSICPILYF